ENEEKEEGAAEETSDEKKGEDGGKAEEAKKEEDGSLKKSVAPGRVFLIADVDFIYDVTVVRRNQIPGLNITIPELLNDNLTLVQNAAEQLSGDPDLIKVRSRTGVSRPFTKQTE